jgi:hypothetical protein
MKPNSKFSGKIMVVILLAILGTVWTLLAKDFWETKDFKQWNEQEAMAMLSNSPWSRVNTIPGNYGGSATPQVMQAGSLANTGASIGQSQGLGGSGSVPLYIRWYSSQKVRQSMCRMGLLRGSLTEKQADEFLQQPMPDYVISISSPMMEPFNQVPYETIKLKTFLLSKKDKAKKIELKSYSPPKERTDGLAIFNFARTFNGAPSVELSDDEMVFVTQVGPTKFQANFKLGKMMVDDKLDL